MSKLTNCQIRALVVGLARSATAARARGDRQGADRRMRRINTYQDELRQREAAGLDPRAHEIQASHIVPVRKGGAK